MMRVKCIKGVKAGFHTKAKVGTIYTISGRVIRDENRQWICEKDSFVGRNNFEEVKEMTKGELYSLGRNVVAILRNGERYLLILTKEGIELHRGEHVITQYFFDKDLTSHTGRNEYDIMFVSEFIRFGTKGYLITGHSIWGRTEELTELTLEEVAKLAGIDVKNLRIKEWLWWKERKLKALNKVNITL